MSRNERETDYLQQKKNNSKDLCRKFSRSRELTVRWQVYPTIPNFMVAKMDLMHLQVHLLY